MTDEIPALIAEARGFVPLHGMRNLMIRISDALEAEHQRAESATRTGERILADAVNYRAALQEALAYIDHHWLAPFRPGETGYELREIVTRALNEGEAE